MIVYIEIVLHLPTGWTKQIERDARRGIYEPHCKNLATLYDGQGNVTQTANHMIYKEDDSNYPSEQAMIDDYKNRMALAIGKPLSAVNQHVDFNYLGDAMVARAHKKANATAYNERV